MNKNQNIVILTGAGISAESGIKTFRATDGLWEEHRIEDVATPQGFAKDPALVHRFYNARRKQLLDQQVAPNLAHQALGEFEKNHQGSFLLVTQNIDDLHERGGSKNLIHMHGELLKSRCELSGQIFETREEVTTDSVCPCCQQVGRLRPHVVWFGEEPLEMNRIYTALSTCDLFIAIGTSANVYPAAGFFEIAKQAGAHTVELNLESTQASSGFDEIHQGKATQNVPAYLNAH